jgi:hypothetical protein
MSPLKKKTENCLDAVVIALGIAFGVSLNDVWRETASMVVVLRLLRVFKVIEEVGTDDQKRMESLREQLAFLFRENESLRGELMHLRAK